MKLTIEEYSKKFKMSKEMIHSRLRAKKLNYITENGTTYIIISTSTTRKVTTPNEPNIIKQKTTVASVLALYQRENQQLKEKIIQLETKIDKLIDDKEQMLRDEMQKIEHVYSSKDEQLKNILELINTKLLLNTPQNNIQDVEAVTTVNPSIEATQTGKIIELKTYIRTLDLKSYQRKIIKKRFLAIEDSDVRLIKQNGNIYLDFSKYDYSDLLEY
ncbi:hypothetical protein JHD48_01365 [Sulfurimonas sp. SAG-AH-194-I05]|nr:hypothetical protein [Sulfurimonas sp. SAG-AH-194-I05]MDF1874378.1 hypothetical protein [Sulfurimonas sp. SAG-AH-194-I05]